MKKKIDIEKYLEGFEKITKDPTLKAMDFIMYRFGNPHKRLKCIHVARYKWKRQCL